MIEIYDNVLEESHIKKISDLLLSDGFPWYYIKNTVFEKDRIDTPSFMHVYEEEGISSKSEYMHLPYTLLDMFSIHTGYDIERIIRIRSNLVLSTNSNVEMTYPHIDYPYKHHVILYYVNDVDGNTVFLNEDGSIKKEIEPKAGRFVIFDGLIWHRLRIPTATRAVFNFNVILK